jgi:hypothetical protein
MYKNKSLFMDGNATKMFLITKAKTVAMLSAWQDYYSAEANAENDYQQKLAAWEKIVNPTVGKKGEKFTKGGISYTPQPTYKSHTAMVDENVDFSALTTDIPGGGEYVFTNYGENGYELGENVTTKLKAIYDKGFGHKGFMSKKGIGDTNAKYVKAYTGSSYDYFNGTLREAFNDADYACSVERRRPIDWQDRVVIWGCVIALGASLAVVLL